jgi:hypothetical protein
LLLFIRRGASAARPSSDLMARENHIFTVVPKADVASALDWRLPVFEAGTHVIAFDGAALLLPKLWRRQSRQWSAGGKTA